MAIVLSTFFGAGVVLLSIVQASPTGAQAGLRDFIFGQAAAIRISDVTLLATITIGTILISNLLMKEWALMCFDEGLARVLGYPIRTLDFLLMALVVAVCVAGMQAVGLLLIVALLIIPPTSARFWSDSIGPNIWLSAIFGASFCDGRWNRECSGAETQHWRHHRRGCSDCPDLEYVIGIQARAMVLRWKARRVMRHKAKNPPLAMTIFHQQGRPISLAFFPDQMKNSWGEYPDIDGLVLTRQIK